MTISESLTTYLVANAGLSALVGDRIAPSLAPEGDTYPQIVYQRISGPRLYASDGPAGLSHPRYTFTCWGRTFTSLDATAAALIAAFDAFTGGAMGGAGGVVVQGIFLRDQRDISDPQPEADDLRKYGRQLDYEIWFEE